MFVSLYFCFVYNSVGMGCGGGTLTRSQTPVSSNKELWFILIDGARAFLLLISSLEIGP